MFETNYTEEMSEKINRYMYLILIDLISKYNRGEYLKLEPVNKDVADKTGTPSWNGDVIAIGKWAANL